MGWKIVEIETDEYAQLYLNNLMIKRQNEKILINLKDIDVLIFNNNYSTMSIRLINALTRNNINIITMNAKHEPASQIISFSGAHNSLKVLEAQINWTNIYKGGVWKDVVMNKITNQMHLLEKLKIQFNKNLFSTYIANVRRYDITNREGHAAKIYWNNLFKNKFIRDHKAEEFPIINSMLNYGYAIIRSMMIRAIIKKGLDTRISLFHKSFTNFFALASDLMEPFRPIVDCFVFQNKNAEYFSYDIRDGLIELLNSKIKIDDKWFYVNKAMDLCVENLIANKGWLWLELWE